MKKQPATLQKKLDAVNAIMSKAKESSANVEAQLKEMKSRDSNEGSGLGFDSADKFQQKVQAISEKKEQFNFGTLRNFTRGRTTVIETNNAQAVDTEIERLLNRSGEPNQGKKAKETKKLRPVEQVVSSKPVKKAKNYDEDEYEQDYENEYEEEQQEDVEDQENEYQDQEEEEVEEEEERQDDIKRFEDIDFGPNDKDPSGIKSIGSSIAKQVGVVNWTQMSEIANMGKGCFIENRENPNDPETSFWIKKVIQGYSDLDFLNALIFAATHEDLFSRIIDPSFDKYRDQGVYVFKFTKNSNQNYYVIVDDRIPTIQKEDLEHVPIGARSDNGTDYWVTLIEKAYAKLHMSYENICSQQLTFQNHFLCLTGLMVEEIPINPATLDSNLLWEFLINFNKFNLPMACRQDKEVEVPLIIEVGHIYIIIDVYENENGRVVKIANPWANAREMREDDTVEDGIGEIDLDDFIKSFSTLLLVKDFPKDWKGIKFDCEITSSKGAPNPQNNSWADNPQYAFEIKDKEEGNIIIRLHRYIGIPSLKLESLGSTFGFAVFPLTQTEITLRTPDLKRNILITKSNEGESWTVANLPLSQGKYTIIPYTVNKGEPGWFYCEIFFDFKENMFLYSTIKKPERILEPSLIKNAIKQSWNPRVLKSTLRLSEFEGSALDEINDNTLLFVPHATTKILYKEGVHPKLARTNTRDEAKTMNRGMSKTLNPAKMTVNRRLFDLKIDGQQDYEISAALFGLAPETTRGSVKDKGVPKDNDMEEIDFDIMASMETEVDFNNFGLTDVGLNALIDAIIQTKKITSLKLAGNKLTDNSIINLIDGLERSHHFELEELDLSNNDIGKFGGDLLIDMTKSFKNLIKVELNGNKNLSNEIKNTIKLALRKKTK